MNKKSDLVCIECEKAQVEYEIFLSAPIKCEKFFDKQDGFYIDKKGVKAELDFDDLYYKKVLCSNGHKWNVYFPSSLAFEHDIYNSITIEKYTRIMGIKTIYAETLQINYNEKYLPFIQRSWKYHSHKALLVKELTPEIKRTLLFRIKFNSDKNVDTTLLTKVKNCKYISEIKVLSNVPSEQRAIRYLT